MYVYVTTSWSNASSKWLAYALLALHKRHRSGAKEHQHQRQHHQQGGGYIWRSPGTYWQSDIGSIHMYVSVRSMYLPGGSFVQSKESRRKQVVGRSSKKSSRPCKGMVAGCSRGTVYITWWHRQQQPQQSWPLNNHIIRHYILYGRSRLLFFLFSFFFPSHLLSSPFYSLSPLVVTQIRGHIAGSFPPLPTTVRALQFYREEISALPSSTRVALCLPTLGALSSWSFFFVCVLLIGTI